jgi:type IV pilus assembly protein PilB
VPDSTVPSVAEVLPPAAEALRGSYDPRTGLAVAQLLVDAGYLTAEQVAHALRVQGKLPIPRSFVRLLRDLRLVTNAQIRECLQSRRISVRLGNLLTELGYLAPSDLKLALGIQKSKPGTKLGEILIENDFVSEHEVLEVLAFQLGYAYVSLSDCIADTQLVKQVPSRWFRTHMAVPIRIENESVLMAFARPHDASAVAAARHAFGDHLTVGIAAKRAIDMAITRIEAGERPLVGAVAAGESGTVALVEAMLADAVRDQASDIHVEPLREGLRVRFRRDGVLVPYKEFPAEAAPSLVSRLKVMAKADIGERRRHQDGRILYDTGRGNIDIRASFYVTIHGEKVVLRLLNNRETLLKVNEINMAPRMLQSYLEGALEAPSGVIMITGPTGSGKTTTLYASVNHLNDARTSIITAEDPVEYVIDGIGQCSINSRINLSYEETLKHIVRQDPDVIVIGEIRDLFSAETAIQAALTGHKVLTTFHTEDSIGGLLRLLNMNIEAFLISSTVVSVLAQRLVRRVCPDCAEDRALTTHEIDRLGYQPRDLAGVTFKAGRGCTACGHLGYRGRVAVFELLVLNEAVKEAVLARRTSYEIRRISAQTSGLVTLLEDGILKAAQGQTTHEEIIRCLPRLMKPRPIPELRRLLGVM